MNEESDDEDEAQENSEDSEDSADSEKEQILAFINDDEPLGFVPAK
jgi:hypothetical protein